MSGVRIGRSGGEEEAMGPPWAGARVLAISETRTQMAGSALELGAVMALGVDRAQALTRAAAAVVELADGDEMVYHVARGTAAVHVGLRLGIHSSLSGMCVREGATLHCRDASCDDRVDVDACRCVGAMSMVCVPLTHSSRVVGVLKVYDPRPYAFSTEDVATLDLLSGVIAAHMAHAADFQEHRHDSRHDALTGLPNRRALDERLATELARVRRHEGLLGLALMDLDRFKQVNDSDGHAAGDGVLRAVAAHLSGGRGEDGAYRLGGDEFALVLVETDLAGADAVITRISTMILTDPACRGVSASFGVTTFKPGDDAATLLGRADAALYETKRSRRAAERRSTRSPAVATVRSGGRI